MNDATSLEGGSEAARRALPDFRDTEKTFLHLSDGELRWTGWLFALMGKPWLTGLLSRFGTWAVRWRLPGAAWGVRNTIYRQFVGGTSLENALGVIGRLHSRDVTSILDFGAEAKSEEADFLRFQNEVLAAIAFSNKEPAANSVVVKVTGLAPNDVLERWNDRSIDFERLGNDGLAAVLARLDSICKAAADTERVQVYIDAEESWFQETIDRLADEMMGRYNRKRVVVLNTFQLYRHDRLEFLKSSHSRAQAQGYLLGAKLVRGAYMAKEGQRADEQGYATPIQPSLEATHGDYNAAVRYCLEHCSDIGVTIGSHNEESMRIAAELLDELEMPRNHAHVHFAQLLGMSDNLTFNLAAAGYNASKYMVYGPVAEVLPYLVRRAQENSSVTGEMGRELRLIRDERRRRRAEQ